MSLDIFLVIFWLISFAMLGADVARYSTSRLIGARATLIACVGTAAGLGALEL